MTPLIFIALAALIGLPPHAARLAPASATETTAKTPRDGPTAVSYTHLRAHET